MSIESTTYISPVKGESTIQKFSIRLKKSMREMHKKVSHHTFVTNLMQKKVTQKSYCQYLYNLFCIYEMLENEMECNRSNESVASICLPNIFRTEAIKKDLEKLNGLSSKPTNSVESYRVHLINIGTHNPHLLVAHAYTRYLGDLFGGQQMKKVIGEMFEGATSFYEFDDLIKEYNVKTPMRFITKYRQILDSLKLTPKEQNEVIEEVKVAFDFADKMLSELD